VIVLGLDGKTHLRKAALTGRVRRIRQTENAISRYKVVQTGPKIQFGGLNDGLVRLAYQGARFG